MSNRNTDPLFQLIRSLEKAEKRHFKLYIKRNSANEDLKIVQLFDAIDKQDDYDEAALLKKLTSIQKTQLPNLKAHLYKQVMASLRLLKTTDTTDLQLSELLDNARVLYNKGLKHQGLRFLEKAKDIARQHHKFNFLAQVISLEKKIETLHITRTTTDTITRLTEESTEIAGHISRVSQLSNLALQLCHHYVQYGYSRNVADEREVKAYFTQNLPPQPQQITDFYELMYLYQSYCWSGFIRQDFLAYYRYSQKWVHLFDQEPNMKLVETGHYIKGMHTLLNAHFNLRNFKGFAQTLDRFIQWDSQNSSRVHENFRIHTQLYISAARINQLLMKGEFAEGCNLVPEIDRAISSFSLYIDVQRTTVFHYKFAMLFFGAGRYSQAIDYLQLIMDGPAELRQDLQCYARLMHLMCHYELGNDVLIDSLTRSVYRFMARMKNLTVVEEEMFRFLRKSFGISRREIRTELEKLLGKIKHLEKNRFESRSFAYLDIISWLESKVQNRPMSVVVQEKAAESKH